MEDQTIKKPKKGHEPGVPFEEFKRSLGLAASLYTDEEIDRIRIVFEQLADMTFDGWLRKKNRDILNTTS